MIINHKIVISCALAQMKQKFSFFLLLGGSLILYDRLQKPCAL